MIINHADDLYTLSGNFALLVGDAEKTDNGYRYTCDRFSVETVIERHKSGVFARRDRVINTSNEELQLRTALSKFVLHGGEYEVYTQYSEWCAENHGAWQPLMSEVCGSNEDLRMNAEGNPFVAVYNLQNGRGMAFHILADSTWQYRVKKHHKQTRPRVSQTVVELGICNRDFACCLMPGESLELPTILYYEFDDRINMGAYKLHRYCNDIYPAREFPVIYNSWLSRADNISHDILAEQLAVAKRIGADYFVIDAGWFGAPGAWYDSVGDWEEYTEASMAGRMREFADLVRAEGLKFGLWFEIERAAVASRAVAAYPQHYIIEDGNAFIDFSSPAACDYIYEVVAAQIRKYDIQFIKSDFNAPITYDRHHRAFLDYFKGYRSVIDRLKREFPDLYLENCASGGLRLALANLHGFDSFWISDNHSLYEEFKIYKGTILRMPCRAIEKWITVQSNAIKGRRGERILMSGDAGFGHVEAIFDDFLKAGSVGGPIGISCDLTALSEQLVETLASHIAQYKSERDFWMRSECRILADTPTVTALEFTDECFDKIKISVFANRALQNGVILYPACDADAVYVDGEGKQITGSALLENGIEVLFEPKRVCNGYTVSLTRL